MTKATGVSFRDFKFLNLFPGCLLHFLNDQLGNPVTMLNDLVF
jgi:hypothetical protein